MFERFTDRARKVLHLANQAAQRFNHECVNTEHLLLGMLKDGAGVALNVLTNFGIDPRKIRLEVEKVITANHDDTTVVFGRLPHAPYAKRSFELAIEEAKKLDHNYVGTEHMLLGLLREPDGYAGQVLRGLGIDAGSVRLEILSLLGQMAGDETIKATRRQIYSHPDPPRVTAGLTGEQWGEVIEVAREMGSPLDAVAVEEMRLPDDPASKPDLDAVVHAAKRQMASDEPASKAEAECLVAELHVRKERLVLRGDFEGAAQTRERIERIKKEFDIKPSAAISDVELQEAILHPLIMVPTHISVEAERYPARLQAAATLYAAFVPLLYGRDACITEDELPLLVKEAVTLLAGELIRKD